MCTHEAYVIILLIIKQSVSCTKFVDSVMASVHQNFDTIQFNRFVICCHSPCCVLPSNKHIREFNYVRI